MNKHEEGVAMEKEVFESKFHTQGFGGKKLRETILSSATKSLQFFNISGVCIC